MNHDPDDFLVVGRPQKVAMAWAFGACPPRIYDQRRRALALSIPERWEAGAQQLIDLSIF